MSEAPIVSIKNLSIYFGRFAALENVSLDIQAGEIFALLGPSGCGKSTLLRIISGFETPSEGELLLDGEDLIPLKPNKRPINMVFQSYAVFPHMSVEDNVAYGLKMEGVANKDIKQRVAESLAQVHLTDFSHRKPHQLSGGQRQRVALARVLVKKPRLLLLDEPLSALDAKLRDAMRLELVKLQEAVGITFVIVTHDQSEAMAMADRIAVLSEGKLRQVAAPAELYQRPVDAFVADFVGTIHAFDVVSVSTSESDINTPLTVTTNELGELVCPATIAADSIPIDQGVSQLAGQLVLAVRPEHIELHLEAPHDYTAINQSSHDQAQLMGRLGDIAFQGQHSIVEVMLDGRDSLTAIVSNTVAQTLHQSGHGSPIWASWSTANMLLLPNHALPA